MSNKWDKLLTEIVGKRITITITKSITGDSWVWIGKIIEHVTDEINGGYIIFEHLPINSLLAQTKKSYVHLGLYHVGMIDILKDDYNPNSYTTCPTCSERLKLEELDIDITKEDTRGEDESHIILLPIALEQEETKRTE